MSLEQIHPDHIIPKIKKYCLELQNNICHFVSNEDGQATFKEDQWQYQEGKGGGITRTLSEGVVIEKAGVGFSHVYGAQLPKAATNKRPELANASFQALGVSTVIHPLNPYVPTSHFNVRFILVEKANEAPHWWFGGGFDLTPYYGFTEDCIHWHEMAKAACDAFHPNAYTKYKKWADEYFYLKHRHEPRGIGGIFYDDVNEIGFDACFNFMQNVGAYYIKAYQPIVVQRKHLAYGDAERQFQCYRRGRYVEFNLLYDRGTLFGLQSGGRTESILMSLPPLVTWRYDWHPKAGTKEAQLYDEFLVPKQWV